MNAPLLLSQVIVFVKTVLSAALFGLPDHVCLARRRLLVPINEHTSNKGGTKKRKVKASYPIQLPDLHDGCAAGYCSIVMSTACAMETQDQCDDTQLSICDPRWKSREDSQSYI